MQPSQTTFVKQLEMNSNCALTFNEPNDLRHGILRRNSQAQVNMVGHRMPFRHFHSLLLAQVPQDPANLSSKFPKNHFAAILRNEYNLILALPNGRAKANQSFPYALSPSAWQGFPEEERIFAGSAKPVRVARP